MSLVMKTRPAAYCVIIQDEQILLSHFSTRTDEGYVLEGWTLPGGGIEIGEQPAQTAVREVAEETGYQVELDELLGVHCGYSSQKDGSTFCALRTIYRAHVVGGDFAVEQEGSTDDARWVPLNELDDFAAAYIGGSKNKGFLFEVSRMLELADAESSVPVKSNEK